MDLDTMQLLIADSTPEFRQALTNALQGHFRIECCGNGRDTLRHLLYAPPDILVLDLMLPELDGLSLLQEAESRSVHPIVLATTRLVNDYIVRTAEALNVSYLILKPCDIRATAARVLDLSRQIHLPPNSAPDRRTHASNILNALGFSASLNGYRYLREAILLMLEEPDQSVTKELYPAVAALCGSTPLQVERSIRSAVEKAWSSRDDRVWMQYFPPVADGGIPKPSNGKFISCLADKIMLDQTAFLPEK